MYNVTLESELFNKPNLSLQFLQMCEPLYAQQLLTDSLFVFYPPKCS